MPRAPEDPIDKAVLAREVAVAPKGTTVLASGTSSALPTFASIRATALRCVRPDFLRAKQMREVDPSTRPFRMTDVPPHRFVTAVRSPTSGSSNNNSSGGDSDQRRPLMFEDTNYLGIANLQILAFWGLTAAAGFGTAIIVAGVPSFPHLVFALPFALFSGWQSYSYYLSTWSACQQATKLQYLRQVQGGIVMDERGVSGRLAKATMEKNKKKQQLAEDEENNNNSSSASSNNESGRSDAAVAVSSSGHISASATALEEAINDAGLVSDNKATNIISSIPEQKNSVKKAAAASGSGGSSEKQQEEARFAQLRLEADQS